jgi:molecular chaperone GrpE (heat shock protein)
MVTRGDMNDPRTITERERPLRSDRLLHPQREIWSLLRAQADGRRADRDATRRRLAEERAPLAELVVAVVNLHHQLAALARTHGPALTAAGLVEPAEVLEGLAEKLEQAARQAGARVLAPDGNTWQRDDETWADVVGSEPDPDVQVPVIRQTVVPGVFLRGELLQRAGVVVAAPPASPEEAPAAPDEDEEPPDNRDAERSRP